MDFLKRLDFKPLTILKVSGVVLLAIIILAVAFRFLGSSFNSLLGKKVSGGIGLSSGLGAYDMMQVADSKSAMYAPNTATSLSLRNIESAQIIVPGQGSTGDQAEEFEVTEYSSLIETRRLEETCATVAELKGRDYIIFENASQSDERCNYSFKVKNDKVEEVLDLIRSLDPKELSQNTYTIQKVINDFTGQLEILQKKQKSIDETLAGAIRSYDEITTLATRTQDVASLAKIIDSKINIIERLTQEKINVSTQIDLLNRSQAEQLDRLEYTYFYLNIIEDKYVDFTNLKDSWQAAVREFIRDVNSVAQDITINLVALLFYIFQYAVYFFILLVVVKYGWQLTKHIWKK